jgi:hypothetical protein
VVARTAGDAGRQVPGSPAAGEATRTLAPPGDDRAAALLAGVARNARGAGVRDLELRYLDEAGPVAADGTWTADVLLSWRFPAADRRSARSAVAVGFRDVDDTVTVSSLGGGDRRTPVWFSGPARVRAGPDWAVVVAETLGREAAEEYAVLVRRALPHVRALVPAWSGGVVVEVPTSAAGVDAALAADAGTYRAVAAVTGSADGSDGSDAPVRVVVNPETLGDPGDRRAQVVMTHEVAHVALGALAADPGVPTWLHEGVADYVALHHAPLPLSTAAGELLDRIRVDGVPDALPSAGEFRPGRPGNLEATYQASWLACDTLARLAGEDALLAVYRDVAGGTPFSEALSRHTGLSRDVLTRRWQERLTDLAA